MPIPLLDASTHKGSADKSKPEEGNEAQISTDKQGGAIKKEARPHKVQAQKATQWTQPQGITEATKEERQKNANKQAKS